MEENSSNEKEIVAYLQSNNIGLGIIVNNKKLGESFSGPRTRIVAADQQIRPFREFISDKDGQSSHDKIDRLAMALGDGRHVHFVPSKEHGTYEAFAVDTDKHSGDPGDEIERQIDAFHQNFGYVVNPGLRSSLINIPNRGPKGRSGLAASKADGDEHDDRYKDIEEERHDKNRVENENEDDNPQAWEDVVAAANKRFEIERKISNQGDNVIQKEIRPQGRNTRPFAGNFVAVQGQTNVERYPVSPIPLNLYKQRRLQTPSVVSNGTEQDCGSPLFTKSCRAMQVQAYRELPPDVEGTSSGITTKSFVNGLAQNPPSPENKVSKWLSQTNSIGYSEDDGSPRIHGKGKTLNVFEDVELAAPAKRKPVKGTAPRNALEDISNLRGHDYLQYNSFYDEPKAATKRNQNVSAMRKSLDEAEEAPVDQSPESDIANHWPKTSKSEEPSNVSSVGSDRAVLEGYVISGPPSLLRSSSSTSLKVSENETKGLLNASSSRAADQAFVLARLEGRVSPKPSYPIKVYANPTWTYSNNVKIEDEGPHLLHPIPLTHINKRRGVANLETVVSDWAGSRAAVQYHRRRQSG